MNARKPIVVAAAALAATILTGCGALNDYSATERTVPSSANVDAGSLALRHLRVHVIDGQSGAPDAAVLRGSFFNVGDSHDALLGVTTPDAGSVNLMSAGSVSEVSHLPLRPGEVQRLQHATDPGLFLAELREPLLVGTSVPVTFYFATQGKVTATVPVTDAEPRTA